MSERCSFVSCDHYGNWPQWFVEKYSKILGFAKNDPAYPRAGAFYSLAPTGRTISHDDIPADAQKALDWDDLPPGFALVIMYLEECDGASRCIVRRNSIDWAVPAGWAAVEYPVHYIGDNCEI